jgi:Ribbon-helix-helix domain
MANVRWNLAIPQETDRSVRIHLATQGGKKGDLSAFVKRAVARQMLIEASEEIKAQTKDIPEQEMKELIDEALEWARSGEGKKLNARHS